MKERYFFGWEIVEREKDPWRTRITCLRQSYPWGYEDEKDTRVEILDKFRDRLTKKNEEFTAKVFWFDTELTKEHITFIIPENVRWDEFNQLYNAVADEVRSVQVFGELGDD